MPRDDGVEGEVAEFQQDGRGAGGEAEKRADLSQNSPEIEGAARGLIGGERGERVGR